MRNCCETGTVNCSVSTSESAPDSVPNDSQNHTSKGSPLWMILETALARDLLCGCLAIAPPRNLTGTVETCFVHAGSLQNLFMSCVAQPSSPCWLATRIAPLEERLHFLLGRLCSKLHSACSDERDICIVWCAKMNGSSDSVLTPSFFLPAVATCLPRVEASNFDIGEQFHDFGLHPSERPFRGVDVPQDLVDEFLFMADPLGVALVVAQLVQNSRGVANKKLPDLHAPGSTCPVTSFNIARSTLDRSPGGECCKSLVTLWLQASATALNSMGTNRTETISASSGQGGLDA